ncbi:MAG TPA: hypothetical protein PKL15_21360 [Saprospiraceae bacterium]|nr:hypothetical protein [Saprospiraceae bacterium]
MTAYTRADVLLHPVEQINHSFFLHAGVEFGVLQANGNCVNIGICRINTTHHSDMTLTRKKQRRCPTADARFYVGPKGRLLAFFPRSGMLPCTERVFFRGPVFPVPVAYCLPESVCGGLPGLAQNIISAGLYLIRKSDEGYWIEF